MKENKFLFGLLILLAAGISANANFIYAQTNDSRLYGTWIFDKIVEVYNDFEDEMADQFDGPVDLGALTKEMGLIEMTITNTTYEITMNGIQFGRGVYTAVNGVLSTNITHIHGSAIGLDSQWHSIAEMQQRFGIEFPDLSETINYSINGNILTAVNNYMKTLYRRK